MDLCLSKYSPSDYQNGNFIFKNSNNALPWSLEYYRHLQLHWSSWLAKPKSPEICEQDEERKVHTYLVDPQNQLFVYKSELGFKSQLCYMINLM